GCVGDLVRSDAMPEPVDHTQKDAAIGPPQGDRSVAVSALADSRNRDVSHVDRARAASHTGRIIRRPIRQVTSATTCVLAPPVEMSKRSASRLVPRIPRPSPVLLWYLPASTTSRCGMPAP